MSPLSIVIIAVLVFLIMRMPAFAKLRPKFLMIAAGGLVLWLVATGKLHALFAVFAAAIPMLQRLLQVARFWPLVNQFLGKNGSASTDQSQVSTASLVMTLDLNSGQVNGQCTDGPCAGMSLDALDQQQLQQQLAWCAQHDPDATGLLQRFAAQRFGQQRADNTQHSSAPPPSPSSLTRKQAAEILGVAEDADPKTVKAAHRRLIAKLHPDKGGNDYLASLLNQAKDKLG